MRRLCPFGSRPREPGPCCFIKSSNINKADTLRDSIRIFYTNADQLSTKINELKTRICIEKPQIVIITEVNNKHILTLPEKIIYNIPEFQMFDKNLTMGHRGILIYIHNSIKDVIEVSTNSSFEEYLLLSIQINKTERFIICCIYRSDSGTQVNNHQLMN